MRKLPVLCPQDYEGVSKMSAVPCDRCKTGWVPKEKRCRIDTGAEHFEPAEVVPECPIQDRCQHQIQSSDPCVVRRSGQVCESALIFAGMSPDDAADHPLAFNAAML